MENTSVSENQENVNNLSSHTQRLEEIDRMQREKDACQTENEEASAFAQSIYEAVNVNSSNTDTPLLPQEDIEDEEPPRINMTAVVCTAIVAVCATIILCVAQPWKSQNEPEPVQVAQVENVGETVKQEATKTVEAKPAETKPAEPVKESEPVKKVEPAKEEVKAETVKPAASTLPVVKTTKTGTDNPYNSVRLIDASSRMLTKSEVEQMTKTELALARNSIFARHGYQFNNAELNEFFAKQSWFKPSDIKMENIALTEAEVDNIRLIKAQESKLK